MNSQFRRRRNLNWSYSKKKKELKLWRWRLQCHTNRHLSPLYTQFKLYLPLKYISMRHLIWLIVSELLSIHSHWAIEFTSGNGVFSVKKISKAKIRPEIISSIGISSQTIKHSYISFTIVNRIFKRINTMSSIQKELNLQSENPLHNRKNILEKILSSSYIHVQLCANKNMFFECLIRSIIIKSFVRIPIAT